MKDKTVKDFEDVLDDHEILFRFRSWLTLDDHDVFFYNEMIAAIAQKIQSMKDAGGAS